MFQCSIVLADGLKFSETRSRVLYVQKSSFQQLAKPQLTFIFDGRIVEFVSDQESNQKLGSAGKPVEKVIMQHVFDNLITFSQVNYSTKCQWIYNIIRTRMGSVTV